jgi:hypothetical protein
MGKVELLPNLLNSLQKNITDFKNNIIDDKNKLLFGYLTTAEALEHFDEIKEQINMYTELYESYLQNYNLLVDNNIKKNKLKESITNYYIQIEQIKLCIIKMNETQNIQFASDAANIYHNILTPLLTEIRQLKYNETIVWSDPDSNTCNLTHNKYSIQNLLYSSFVDKVISYDVGLKVQTTKKSKINLVIADETDTPILEDGRDVPIYGEGKDGVSWKIPEYTVLWDKMQSKLKNALKTDPEWLEEFMFECVNSKAKGELCKFITPKNLKMPPTLLPSGDYDFGINIYNESFKKLNPSLQKTYLTFYSTDKDTNVKNYTIFRDAMDKLVSNEVHF